MSSSSNRYFRAVLFAGAAFASVAASPLYAQAASSDEVAEEADEEIVVTARRREESLLDVPVAVSAFSGAQLEQQGALDITDVANMTPNTTLENSRATNSTLSAFIRGVGQQDPVGGFEAGVGIYLDDVYLNRPQAAVLDIYDVKRIEVLRGPQGTLYGRNTIGGAVKYVTAELPDVVAVKARATYGTYNQAEGVLTASAPIGDLFRVGGSVARLTRDGFGKNLTTKLENYNKDLWAVRGTAEFGGNGAPVLIRISGDYTKDKSAQRGGHRLIPGLVSGVPVLADVYDTRGALVAPKQDIEAYGLAMNVRADLSDHFTLRSISAWRKDTTLGPIDFDALPAVDVDVPGLYKNEQLSQEFQLLYNSDRLNGLIGFYYLDAQAITNFDVLLSTTSPGFNAYTAGTVNTDTWSVFGDFTFDFTDQISLSVGGRYTVDHRDSTVMRQSKLGTSAEFGGTPVILATTSDFRGKADFKEFTPRASLSYKPTEDHMVYASFSQGFKGGGFDPRGQSTACRTTTGGLCNAQQIYDFMSFEPETVNSYEIGYKGSLADGRVRVALTGFYADYKDVQVPGSAGYDSNGDGVNDTFIGITTNAGKARMKGVEFETFARLAPDFAGAGSDLNLTAAVGYIDGKYLQFINALGVDVAQYRHIQNTPSFTASATLAAVIPVGTGEVNASTGISYKSKTHQFEFENPFLDQEGYALWDASVTWKINDNFSFGVHGKNLSDTRYKTSGYWFGAVNPTTGLPLYTSTGNIISALGKEGVVTAFYGNPRQIFATVGFKF